MKIQIQNLGFEYADGFQALKDISLILEPGSCNALMGANGAGKTTLAKHLNGLLSPVQGRVLLGNTCTRGIPPHTLAPLTAYMFQNPDDQLFSRTVREEITFGPKNLGFDSEKTDYLVNESLKLTGLVQASAMNPLDLPANQRRLCCLASVLAMDSQCFVLDEPTQGLDFRDIEQVANIIRFLRNKGKSIVIITHDLDFAVEHMQDGIVLSKGRLMTHAPLENIFSRPDLCRQWDISLPQMARLGLALNMDQPPLTPAGFVEKLAKQRGIK